VGTSLACLAEQIAAAEVDPLALGMIAKRKELVPASESTAVFRDCANLFQSHAGIISLRSHAAHGPRLFSGPPPRLGFARNEAAHGAHFNLPDRVVSGARRAAGAREGAPSQKSHSLN